jgi:malonyl-CoA O-methyltransferase
MAERLVRRLEGGPEPRRILELGCGTGYLTELLACRYPDGEILAFDFAERMVDLARHRLRKRRAEVLLADAEAADLGAKAWDLVVSSATIQWFDRPLGSMSTLASALRPGGRMLHATFGPGTFCELKSAMAGSGPFDAEPAAIGLPLRTAEEWRQLLSESGLGETEVRTSTEVVEYPAAIDFLHELQATGVTCRPNGAEAGPLMPRVLREALERYDDRFGTTAGVPVTYELVEVSGHRPG